MDGYFGRTDKILLDNCALLVYFRKTKYGFRFSVKGTNK